ncbi:hypothetical protein AVEN_150844-1 [Araneus ventricosus]|uniref:HTH psq-type domain-containing protein n=1 Tax=Araneus ventricosus TaxID=182803 RepID=A0A4Y2JA58_ARAVE|nr:hypothetical protein AVEN_150844-1 [Araneus ventricosus]
MRSVKRERNVLNVTQKLEILQKLDNGESASPDAEDALNEGNTISHSAALQSVETLLIIWDKEDLITVTLLRTQMLETGDARSFIALDSPVRMSEVQGAHRNEAVATSHRISKWGLAPGCGYDNGGVAGS